MPMDSWKKSIFKDENQIFKEHCIANLDTKFLSVILQVDFKLRFEA